MRRRLFTCVALAAAAVLSSCTSADETDLTADERVDAFDASVHSPRTFSYTRTQGDGRLEVRGRVEDDYRYQADVASKGEQVYQEVVFDDRRFVRVSAPTATAAAAAGGDAESTAALARGEWVRDGQGAPGEFAAVGSATADSQSGSGPAPGLVLGVVRALENADQAERFGSAIRGARSYDPDSSEYLERNDKFPPHPESGRRYDAVPGPYQPDVLFADGVPDDLAERLTSSSLYLSFWFRDGRLTRIEAFFDVDVKRVADDMRTAMRLQAARSGARLDPATVPPAPQPYRETYTFEYPKDPVKVEAPAAVATVSLGSAPAPAPAR